MKKTFKHKLFTAEFSDESGYISLTGTYEGGSGAVGDSIADIYPNFKEIADMHLFNVNPVGPMHSISNAIYYIEEGDFIALSNHWLISKEEAKDLIRKCIILVVEARQEARDLFVVNSRHFNTLKDQISRDSLKGKMLSQISAILKETYNEFTRDERAEFLGLFAPEAFITADAFAKKPSIAITKFQWFLSNLSTNSENSAERLPKVIKLMSKALEKHHKTPQELTEIIHEQKVRAIVEDYEVGLRPIWEDMLQDVYFIVERTPSNLTGGFIDPYDEDGNTIEGYGDWEDETEDHGKVIAVAMEEDCDVTDVTELSDDEFSACGKQYLVLTSDEVDWAVRKEAEHYIEDVIMPEAPESLRNYIDEDRLIEDIMSDGAGRLLSRYDGCERVQTYDKEQYFLYRQ